MIPEIVIPEIVITVAPDGSTRIETRGFQGAACQQASRFLERALGACTGEQLTSEFFTEQVVQAQPVHPAQQH